jgi:predicted HTH domain antitoxin
MNLIQHIPKTELARHTRQVIQTVQRGQTVVIESHGQPEVAIMDIVDFYLIHAVLNHYAHPPQERLTDGLPDTAVVNLPTAQAKYDLVLTHYLQENISLGRVAELLELPWVDLRWRFVRLNIPLRVAPADRDELEQDIASLRPFFDASPS